MSPSVCISFCLPLPFFGAYTGVHPLSPPLDPPLDLSLCFLCCFQVFIGIFPEAPPSGPAHHASSASAVVSAGCLESPQGSSLSDTVRAHFLLQQQRLQQLQRKMLTGIKGQQKADTDGSDPQQQAASSATVRTCTSKKLSLSPQLSAIHIWFSLSICRCHSFPLAI